jgi:hypothetical protein
MWQEYLPAKWLVSLYERFKGLKLVWLEATCGTREENNSINKGLSNIFFYRQVLPSIKLFSREFIATLSEFQDIIAKVTGINLNKSSSFFSAFKIELLKMK